MAPRTMSSKATTMTTEPGRPLASSTPTSVVVAKILTVGASAGSLLVLMAAMAVGQQPEASPAPLDPAPATQPAASVDQVPSPRPPGIGSSATSRSPQVAEVPRDPVPERAARSWSAPKSAPRSVPRSEPRSVPTSPRVTPTRPAPTPTPHPVVRPAPPTRTPDATSRAS